jgi:hypothetical protein
VTISDQKRRLERLEAVISRRERPSAVIEFVIVPAIDGRRAAGPYETLTWRGATAGVEISTLSLSATQASLSCG